MTGLAEFAVRSPAGHGPAMFVTASYAVYYHGRSAAGFAVQLLATSVRFDGCTGRRIENPLLGVGVCLRFWFQPEIRSLILRLLRVRLPSSCPPEHVA